MRRTVWLSMLTAGGMLVLGTAAQAADTRLWNLTVATLNSVQLAPAGTTEFGPNQCLNDPDKSVDHDERLKITGVAAGRYDVKLTDVNGRTCMARNIEVKPGKVFSVEEKKLTDCTK